MATAAKGVNARQLVARDAPVLRQKAKRVHRVDQSIRTLIDEMLATMVLTHGVGLAAPQVGVGLRVAVIKVDGQTHVFVNPVLVQSAGEQIESEACLSLPGYMGETRRYQEVTVRGLNRNGKLVKLQGKDLLARVLQHELDHLDGVLFTDRLTGLEKLQRLRLPGIEEDA